MSNLKFPNTSYSSLCENFPKPGSRRFAYATELDTMLDPSGTLVFGVYHHGSLIAVIRKNKVSVSNAGWSSRTTIDRIHRILTDNNTGFGACIHKGESKVFDFTTGDKIDMPHDDFVTYPTALIRK